MIINKHICIKSITGKSSQTLLYSTTTKLREFCIKILRIRQVIFM